MVSVHGDSGEGSTVPRNSCPDLNQAGDRVLAGLELGSAFSATTLDRALPNQNTCFLDQLE